MTVLSDAFAVMSGQVGNHAVNSEAPVKGYIIDLSSESLERLTFQANPAEISDATSLQSKDVVIVGGSHPRMVPVAGGARVITLSLYFYRDESTKAETWVKEQVRWLQSLRYPYRGADGVKNFASLQFVFGKLYNLTCKLKDVKVKYLDKFSAETLLPWHGEVDLTLQEEANDDVSLFYARDSAGDGAFTRVDWEATA